MNTCYQSWCMAVRHGHIDVIKKGIHGWAGHIARFKDYIDVLGHKPFKSRQAFFSER